MARRRERGVVILVVLGIVAVASVAAVNMLHSQSVTVRRFEGYQNIEQAAAIAAAAERFAAATLFRDAPEDDPVDSREDGWATVIPPLPVAGGTISGCVHDLNGLFNVNNLIDAEGVANAEQLAVFLRLLDALALPRSIGFALVDWLDADTQPQPDGGAEFETYAGGQPPYRPADRPMVSTTELRQVVGLNDSEEESLEAYQSLLPYVAALPRGNLINVNTASPELLSALSDDLVSHGDTLHRWPDEGWKRYPACGEATEPASALTGSLDVDSEDRTPYESLESFTAASTVEVDGVNKALPDSVKNLLSVSSTHFLVRADIEFGGTAMTQYSVLQRETDGRSQVLGRWRALE
ncbi:MAG: type II secretion system minor pseudopilin GspK [Pseudomonadota bacterium]